MITIPFVKMHGLGNDYVFVNCFSADGNIPFDDGMLSCLTRKMSDRHFGIGSDGLVLIMPSEVADLRMRMFNADGTEAQMCGNAARCIGKFAYEKGLCRKREMTLQTLAGIKRLKVDVTDGKVEQVTVSMGSPKVAMDLVEIEGERISFVNVNIGNPHAVVFTDDTLDDIALSVIGPKWERHPHFAEGTNVEFAHIDSRAELTMRVWERGTGETMACGTGACAVAAAAVTLGKTDNQVTVRLKGGCLNIRIDENNGDIYMTGTATEVFCGNYIWED